SRVREFAVSAGKKFGGPELIGSLPDLLDDPNLSVQETAMQALGNVAPDLLRARADVLRRKFTEWRGYDDNDPIIHLAWIAVKLDMPELVSEVRRIFWLATLILLFTSIVFQWIPAVSFEPFLQDPLGNLSQVVIPGISVSVFVIA